MGIFRQFPYSNFHELNLDEIIKIMRQMQDEWAATKTEWASYKDFIDNYFKNLNLDEETENALRRMIADGTLDSVIDPVIIAEVTAWLADHITQPTTPAIDTSLTIAGAAADSKTVGDKFTSMLHAVGPGNVYEWELGTIDDNTGADSPSTSRIRSEYINVIKGTVISVNTGYDHVLMAYNYDKSKRSYIQNTWTADDIIMPYDALIRIVVRKHSNTLIDESEIFEVASNEFVKMGVTQITNTIQKEITPIWNQGAYGIYIDGEDIKMRQNGFGMIFRGGNYYIASLDHATEYVFSKPVGGTNYPYFLVLDTTKVDNLGGRSDPSVVLSVIDVYDFVANYKPEYVIVAQLYPSYWDFVAPFDYFKRNISSYAERGPVSDIFTQNQLSAHMGGNVGSPNTIAAFTNAISNGYKVLEGDVQFTSDGVAVLSHEDYFVIGGVTYTIATETYATLISVKPDLATVKEMLILCKKNNVVAELDFTKTYNVTQQIILLNDIEETGMLNRCFITCYASTARSLLGANNDVIVCVSGINNTSNVDAIADIIKNARLCICSTTEANVTQALIDAIHKAGALSKPWTVNTLATVQTLFNYGADFIITDSVLPSDL